MEHTTAVPPMLPIPESILIVITVLLTTLLPEAIITTQLGLTTPMVLQAQTLTVLQASLAHMAPQASPALTEHQASPALTEHPASLAHLEHMARQA